MSNIFDERYWEDLEIEVQKIDGFEDVKVGSFMSSIHMTTKKYRVMFDIKKRIPDDFFSKPGINTTKNEPFVCHMAVCENDMDKFLSLMGEMEEKEYGENMPGVDMVVTDIKKMLEKIDGENK